MWLIENPWPVVVVCVCVALMCVFLWSRNKQGKYLLAASGALLLSGGAFAVDGMVLTESEKIELQVVDLCHSFQRGDLGRAESYFSESVPELRELVRQASRMVRVANDLSVRDLNLSTIGTPPHYQVRFRANGTVFLKIGGSEENGGYQPSQWELLWKQEPVGWRIVRLSRLNPLNQQVMEVFEVKAH